MYYTNKNHDFYYRFSWGIYNISMAKIDKDSKKRLTSIDVPKEDFNKMKANLEKTGWVECTDSVRGRSFSY